MNCDCENTERWLPTQYDGYSVSDHGRVIGPQGTILKPNVARSGYPSIWIRRERQEYVHQLVCTAFHGPRPSKRHQAAHGDGTRTNNHATNLRWATPIENARDTIRHGRNAFQNMRFAGEDSAASKLTWELVAQIRSQYAAGEVSLKALAANHGVSRSTITAIVRGKSWRTDNLPAAAATEGEGGER